MTIGIEEYPDTQLETLIKMASDDNRRVRFAADARYLVAANTNTPVETLYWRARFAVANNPNTPAESLNRLASDSDEDVRYCVAKNPNTSVETLNRLSSDDDWRVRRAVARHPNTSAETLNRLSSDDDRYVRCAAEENIRNRRTENERT